MSATNSKYLPLNTAAIIILTNDPIIWIRPNQNPVNANPAIINTRIASVIESIIFFVLVIRG